MADLETLEKCRFVILLLAKMPLLAARVRLDERSRLPYRGYETLGRRIFDRASSFLSRRSGHQLSKYCI